MENLWDRLVNPRALSLLKKYCVYCHIKNCPKNNPNNRPNDFDAIELPPCSVAAADRERPLDVVVEAASAFLSGPAKRLLAPNMFILDAVLC